MKTIGKQTAEHYTWGDGCDGWHLARTATLSVIEERMPSGTSEARHYHQKANQFFYVLRGMLSIEINQREFQLNAGQGIEIAAGQTHHVHNRSAVDAEFLVISNPPSHGDRILVEAVI
jgi:mannose-6-phosphate isomerase-like protein (cupin superfamily)